MPDQRREQAELGRGQIGRRTVHVHLVRGELHQQVPVVVDVGCLLGSARAPQQRLHPRGQLTVAERLGQVVVGPALQAPHLFALLPVRGEHEDGDVADVAYPLEDLPAIQRRQPDIEDHHVGPLGVEVTQPQPAVGGGGHVETAAAQHGADAERDVGVILDDQDPRVHAAAGHETRPTVPRSSVLSTWMLRPGSAGGAPMLRDTPASWHPAPRAKCHRKTTQSK